MSRCKSGKIRYATELDAKLALVDTILRANRGKSKRQECRYYECRLCGGGYHLTSKPLQRPPRPVPGP